FLMVIHSARPQAAGTTQNNPLKTNGPKNPDPSNPNAHHFCAHTQFRMQFPHTPFKFENQIVGIATFSDFIET
ncbi:MAG: hypothetical protein KH140_06235, partial [Actinomyces sp.]|nr:hypothetical protein [Actinomyces sp.]